MSLANLFRRPHYTSEATDFIEQLKKERPALDQRTAWVWLGSNSGSIDETSLMN